MSENSGGPGQVETHADGSKTFTHALRFPDNSRVVIQEYNAAGQLVSARIHWTGFAGDVLNLTVTFGPDGQVLKEDGFRAPGVSNPVSEFIKPLPQTAPTPAQPDTSPVNVPPLAPAATENPAPDQKTDGPAAPVPPANPSTPASTVTSSASSSTLAPATQEPVPQPQVPASMAPERRTRWNDDSDDGSDN